jgi:exosortase K
MTAKIITKHNAQLVVVLLCAAALKLYYSTASANRLRWILAPTTALVELVTGWRFEFESHAGYMSSDRSFIIAASCAGVNFLITSFLMLSLRKMWRDRPQDTPWSFIPFAALLAYLATIVANTVRISTALRLHRTSLEMGWLSPNQLHRFEGIFIYFGFLLLLFTVSEKNSGKVSNSENAFGPYCGPFFPLLFYYSTTLVVPIANGSYRLGAEFWEHTFFVLLTPLALILPLAAFRFYRYQQGKEISCLFRHTKDSDTDRQKREIRGLISHALRLVPIFRCCTRLSPAFVERDETAKRSPGPGVA